MFICVKDVCFQEFTARSVTITGVTGVTDWIGTHHHYPAEAQLSGLCENTPMFTFPQSYITEHLCCILVEKALWSLTCLLCM